MQVRSKVWVFLFSFITHASAVYARGIQSTVHVTHPRAHSSVPSYLNREKSRRDSNVGKSLFPATQMPFVRIS